MKRIVVLCDGSWQRPDGRGASNVVHLARSVLPATAGGVTQVVYYVEGSQRDYANDRSSVAQVARTIDSDIQAIYRFLVHNYNPGDQILFFGFSRGAYIVRSCIGMLRNVWLLRREHAHLIPQAYHIYRTLWHADADNALRFSEPHCREVPVRFLGVWDTVGERGIPLELFPGLDAERYAFHDTVLSRIVENACQALAIDERRAAFIPTLWTTRSDRKRTQQAWFAGSHNDIGGGYREAGLAHLSLRWMAEQAMRAGLELDEVLLDSVTAINTRETVHSPSAPHPHGFCDRPIGIGNADEMLHPSAEQRFLHQPRYRPRNLVEFLARDEQIRLPI